MLEVVVLGSAAGGGVPQWNCRCEVCAAAWADPSLRNGQASVAVSADGGANWFLINASPDLRQQILDTPRLHPTRLHPTRLHPTRLHPTRLHPTRLHPGPGRRHSPIAGVILTNGEIDAVAGLLSLREGWPFAIHAHPRVLATLAQNSLFDVLPAARVPRRPIAVGEAFEPSLQDGAPSGLVIEAFAVPGKPAWYVEAAGGAEGDTIGLTVRDRDGGSVFHFVPACAEVDPPLADRLRGAALVFFDGTLWTDDEMQRAGLADKTGRRMGHAPISGSGGSMERLGGLGIDRKIFIHLNNSNPVLLAGSAERLEAERAGWSVAAPGMEIRP